jgi:signal transduction histidine kinase/DNA-binding response OmpR family regulator/ligand-binding sensor domain-containing protein
LKLYYGAGNSKLTYKYTFSGLLFNKVRSTKSFVLMMILFFSSILFGEGKTSYIPKYSNPFNEPWRWQGFSELVGKACRCMTEDKSGVIWFGVSGGVYRYDGTHWKFFPLGEDLSDLPVVSLLVSSDGYLYIGTTKGVKRLKDGQWESIQLNLDFGDTVEHPYNKIPIIETEDHSIWIGTHQGVVRIKDQQMTLYRETEIYTYINNYDSNKQNIIKNLSSFDVYNIFEDKSGNLWFGLRDGRVFRCKMIYDMTSNLSWHRVYSESGYIKSRYPMVKVTSSGKVFIASGQNDGGINIYSDGRWRLFKTKPIYKMDDIYSDIIELSDGSICIGGIGRVITYQNNSWKLYESSNFLFSSNRLILYESKNKSLWIIGLGNEVWRIDLSYQTWATLRGLSYQTEDKNGNKWFISYDGSIIRCDLKMQNWVRYTKSDGTIDVPVVLFVSKNGDIWAAGSDNQIAATACFDGNKWTKQVHPKLGWGIDRRAYFEASDGSLWFGSASDVLTEKGQAGGIVKYTNVTHHDNIQYEYHYSNESLFITGIYGIGQTSDGTIYAGQLGLYCLKPGAKVWKRVLDPAGINASFVDCIKSSPDGDLWLGTRTNGVYFLDGKTGRWKKYTVSDGLSSNTIINIFIVSNKDVWVATNRDISHFDGISWTKSSFHSFLKPKLDGISIRQSRDGGLWVDQNSPDWYRKALYKDSFSDSFDDFYTTRYYPDKLPPETSITFSQEKIAQPGNVLLSWTASDPWKLTPSEQIQYSYRMDDNEWSPYTYKTSDIFLSLPSGPHTFEVRARDRALNVDPKPAKVSFYVVYPIWAQPWFILLILTFLTTIAYFLKHLYARNRIIAEMSETKMRLFANISHELRTPLTLIIGPLLKILDSPLLDQELKKPLNLVNKNCHRLLRLINQVLDFRKLEAGQLKFEPKLGDIIDFLKEEVNVFEEFAISKKINLQFDSGLPKQDTWFDPDKIEKIMFNILSNALKFTPQGGSVTVNVIVKNAEKPKSINFGLPHNIVVTRWLEICIKDSGIGIAKRNLDKIFNNFYQVQDHLKTAVGGTGIGLSVAKEMIQVHGGKINVESSEGEGTSFNIKLPVIEGKVYDKLLEPDYVQKSEYLKMKFPEEDREDAQTEPLEIKTSKKGKNKILVVEDNAEMRKYIRQELEKEYEIQEAVDGVEALNVAMNFYPDLIISDIMMPQMDGIEFCRRIKTDERTSHIAVILLTARSSQEYKIEGLETGADDYIVKPFYSSELLLRIRNILESRKKFREKFGQTLKIEPSTIEITSVDQKFMKRAIEIIEEHMDDSEFSVEIFSKLVGMSRVSLYNKLKSLSNLSVQEFIFAIRLKRAAQLLKESGMTITEIAYSVGFKDPSHFSKLFKKQFGVSPKVFVHEKNQNPEPPIESAE